MKWTSHYETAARICRCRTFPPNQSCCMATLLSHTAKPFPRATNPGDGPDLPTSTSGQMEAGEYSSPSRPRSETSHELERVLSLPSFPGCPIALRRKPINRKTNDDQCNPDGCVPRTPDECTDYQPDHCCAEQQRNPGITRNAKPTVQMWLSSSQHQNRPDRQSVKHPRGKDHIGEYLLIASRNCQHARPNALNHQGNDRRAEAIG